MPRSSAAVGCAVATFDFTKDDAALSAKLEVKAEKKGDKAPRFDAMIAAVAINRGFKLFTFNKDHFKGFEELELF